MSVANLSLLRVSVGGVDYTGEVGKCTITAADTPEEERALCEVPRSYYLNLTLLVDHATGSLWRQVFDAAGTDVAVVYMPFGNTTPTEDQPHYSMTAEIAEPDGELMGGVATKRRRTRQTVEVKWKLGAKPVPVTDLVAA